MPSRNLLLFALSSLFLPPALHAQTSTPPAVDPDRQVLHTSTREVVLDLVVRDKRHHAVTDLRPEEVEVYEDGVRQTVREFRNVQGAEQLQIERTEAGAAKTAADKNAPDSHALNSMRQVNFVSVVFAEISPLNLEFSRGAVQEFLKSDNVPNTYVTVYKLDRVLRVVQPYTSDKDLLAKAVDAAAKGFDPRSSLDVSASVADAGLAGIQANAANVLSSPTTTAAQAQAVENELLTPIPALTKDPLFYANASAQDASFVLGNALLVQADLAKGLRLAGSLSNGMDSMDALHALVRSQEKLPGRKIVLYLADGLAFPVNRRDVVDNLISYANRSGVSFYTLDTRGLNAEDPMMQAMAAQHRGRRRSIDRRRQPSTCHARIGRVDWRLLGHQHQRNLHSHAAHHGRYPHPL